MTETASSETIATLQEIDASALRQRENHIMDLTGKSKYKRIMQGISSSVYSLSFRHLLKNSRMQTDCSIRKLQAKSTR